jgi:hypothetical protein
VKNTATSESPSPTKFKKNGRQKNAFSGQVEKHFFDFQAFPEKSFFAYSHKCKQVKTLKTFFWKITNLHFY